MLSTLLSFVLIAEAAATTTTVTATTAVNTMNAAGPSAGALANNPTLLAGGSSQVDPCAPATHPCTCAAALSTCAWLSYANGGGKCVFDAQGSVDCGVCPEQTKCGEQGCSAFTEPCKCALSTSSCAWSQDQNACVKATTGTACGLCPNQPICKLAKPKTVGFHPQSGSRGSGDNDVLQVIFNVEMKWCDKTSRSVTFWCDGSLPTQLGAANLAVVATALKADASDALSGVARDEPRVCGLVIPPDLLCDHTTGAPYAGLTKGAYSFTLTDTSPPRVQSFNPKDGAEEVDPNTIVQFTFNEPIVLGPSTLFLTFTTMNTDRSGEVSSAVTSKSYPLDIPYVSAKGDHILQFDMKDKTKPGWMYSIALPRGAVEDMSGNVFAGLAGGKYTFTTRQTSLRYNASDGGSDMTGIIVGIVVGIVIGGFCVAALIWKFQTACYGQHRYKPTLEKHKSNGSVPVPAGKQVQPRNHIDQVNPKEQSGPSPSSSTFLGAPTQNPENAPPRRAESSSKVSWARAGSPAPKPERIYPEPERIYPETASGTEQRRAYSRRNTEPPGPAPKSSASEPPGPPPRSTYAEARPNSKGPSAQASASKPPHKSEKPSNTATSPLVESSSPETRAVEKKMRDMMNEPLAVRKKLLKDLMLEHHPDKNAGSDTSKETFQFINGAKGWFLHDE